MTTARLVWLQRQDQYRGDNFFSRGNDYNMHKQRLVWSLRRWYTYDHDSSSNSRSRVLFRCADSNSDSMAAKILEQ